MLVLTGLPTLFPKLVDARTYTERMFHTIARRANGAKAPGHRSERGRFSCQRKREAVLDKLNDADSREAIIRPIQDAGCPVMFNEESVKTISKISGGYPFFIQFICKEVYDVWVQKASFDEELPTVPVDEIMRKLDSDFFAGRWTRVTDRQRELLNVIANLENCDAEFMVQDIVSRSRAMSKKPFGSIFLQDDGRVLLIGNENYLT